MSVIDDIKARLDIVDVVSQYATLNQSGRNLKALCPFHQEKTPSFFVFPERQSWRCFGACAEGGDAFSFVMKAEQLSFGDTLKVLAQRTGVALTDRRSDSDTDILFKINEETASYFAKQLKSPQGTHALSYLKGRWVNEEAIATFRLGYSPRGGEEAKKHLLRLGLPETKLVEAGILRRDDYGSTRDLFRGRLMFPIHNKQSRIAGFGGRSLDDSQPKYLNSPQTPIFTKSNILYGLNLGAEFIRKEGLGVIVEGYMDAITAHQYGYRNVVASMGTALTGQQVRQLRGLATSFVLALDPDTAGQSATMRSLKSSWEAFEPRSSSSGGAQFSSLKIASMAEGKDPDQVIKESPKEWDRIIQEAVPWEDFYFSSIASRFDLTVTEDKARVTEELTDFIKKIPNAYRRYQYFQRLADLVGVPISTLEASAGRSWKRDTRRTSKRVSHQITRSALEKANREPLEEYTLSLLLRWPDLKEHLEDFSSEYFHRSENREVFTFWLECSTIEVLREGLDISLQSYLDDLSQRNFPPTDRTQSEKALADCLMRLEQRHLRELKLQEQALFSDEEAEKVRGDILARNDRLRQLYIQNRHSR